MRRLGNEKKAFYKRFTGKTVRDLTKGKRYITTELLKGITSNYIPMHVACENNIFNTLVQVTIKKIKRNHTVFGVRC